MYLHIRCAFFIFRGVYTIPKLIRQREQNYGVKPTEREVENIMAVNPDFTINYVGTNGRIAYGSGIKCVGNQRLIRIDYERILKNK